MEYRWNYIDRERPRYSEKGPGTRRKAQVLGERPSLPLYFVNHKPHMVWSAVTDRLQSWQGRQKLIHIEEIMSYVTV